MSDYVLLTGGTGLLGRYLLRDLVDHDVSVAMLVRPSRRMTAEERVDAIIATWESQLGRELPRPHVIEGDLAESDLGLDQYSRDWLVDHCDTVLHNAASLTFHATDPAGEPWRTNVQGTQNILELCRDAGIRDVHYVSTAYVCGLRSDRVSESDLDVGQEPGNDYERSKIAAETMIREADFISPATIFRPSIIVGDSRTGFTTTFHGFYAALRLAHTLLNSSAVDNNGRPTRLTLSGSERKNLVSVDWVSAAIVGVLVQPEYHGRTFHLTSPSPVTTLVMRDVLEELIDNCENRFVGSGPLKDPSLIERLFYEQMQVYDSYWRDDPVFDASNTTAALPELPCPEIDHELLVRLSRTAIDMGFRWRERVPSEETPAIR
ncbi:MAG: SDR family oxidoreductase [Planctomycetaceae bacterium]